MLLNEPLCTDAQLVVECTTEVLYGVNRAHPQELLLECANEPFSHAVAFRGAHERWTRRDPQKPEFNLEITLLY